MPLLSDRVSRTELAATFAMAARARALTAEGMHGEDPQSANGVRNSEEDPLGETTSTPRAAVPLPLISTTS